VISIPGLEQIGPEWVVDAYTSGDVHLWRRLETRVALQTPFQALEIARLETLGWCLLLDGKIQSSELDDKLYHELLVHPALLAHPRPRRVLILGGGEGATLREVLRHPTVDEAVMVDLDGDVVRLCREHLPFYADGAFDDPRATLVIGDAWRFLQERASSQRFDVVIGDLTDPGPVGPAGGLYNPAFFGAIRRCLARNGLFVSQVGGLRYARERALALDIAQKLRASFASVLPYGEFIATYDFVWVFLLATCSPRTSLRWRTLQRRVAVRGLQPGHYGERLHQRAFALPWPEEPPMAYPSRAR
jgi:spermidine synthase